ncbi:UGMP family protein [Thiohalorhabdus denitrificans]|uniref:tRNA N6-adenosine threonylcarbamoyltransferase n=1 Tax=Thiohalorhabdus denitrificans TaxID=381306 RepID=A0A0P9C7B5_9GAMM|nr:tRNA (adenosine(37)-N6)-threonylcarbamoyltransferase complex transferase subunit TsaD [Thiohalorhabdus denitrificans]KPV41012.1 UGMP family protein [Thiohalorhabdus denitrificans]SCY41749.1 O-sialoglycoprotein endopeptidase [Thiohalorhabdus denitrificans]
MRVLGIETSCDETGVALWDSEAGLLAHRLHSQTEVHAAYGGVVPELASRDHIRRTIPLVEQTLADAGVDLDGVDGVTATAGPGLLGALLVGLSAGKAIAFARDLPFLGIHHLEAHLLAPALEDNPPPFPFLALLVSGGHTLLAEVAGVGRYRLLGQSLDDAAGEAFDKTAKLLELGFPGGPAVARAAEGGDPEAFALPRPMVDKPNLDFSFSGLKTAVLNAAKTRGEDADAAFRRDLCASFQEAVVDVLWRKSARALRQTGLERLVVAGGVGANAHLRARFATEAEARSVGLHFPRPEFCTDNGAMVAHAGGLRLLAGERDGWDRTAVARWPLDELTPPSI